MLNINKVFLQLIIFLNFCKINIARHQCWITLRVADRFCKKSHCFISELDSAFAFIVCERNKKRQFACDGVNGCLHS